MKYCFVYITIFVLVLFSAISCTKDVDFDQAENVQLTPEVELNLIFFNLVADDFFDQVTQTPRLVVSDTTDIEIYDGDAIQESLRRAEFEFNFTNSIPRQFDVDFEFLTLENTITYTTGTDVLQGQNGEAIESQFIEEIEGEDLANLLEARKVVVTVTIPDANAALQGSLNLQSKTTYFLEIE